MPKKKHAKPIFPSFLTLCLIILAIFFLLPIKNEIVNQVDNVLPINFFIVQSGSMEPAIMTGDLIVVAQNQNYQAPSTITFFDDKNRVVTHRIVSTNQEGNSFKYLTKGDANQDQDIVEVAHDRVIGAVVMSLPKLGFLAQFAQSTKGLLILIAVPSVLLGIYEFKNIFLKRN